VFLELGDLRNAQLLQEPIKTLCAGIGVTGAVRLLHEFSDGFSETRVVLGQHQAGPGDLQPFHFVFKVGAAAVLREEVHRYLDFVSHARAVSAFVPIHNANETLTVLASNQSLGAIAYAHASDVLGGRNCVSFKQVFRESVKGERDISSVIELIDSLARIIGSLYSAPTNRFAHEIALYYLEHWAPDYLVAPNQIVNTPNHPLLTLDRLNPDHFPQEPSSTVSNLRKEAETANDRNHVDIVLPRCVIARVQPEQLLAWVNSADDLALVVDTRDIPADSLKRISKGSSVSLWTPKKVSRYDFYLRHIRMGLPSLDVGAPTFDVGKLRLPNPLVHMSTPLLAATRPPSATLMVPGHGDLHPGNVLVIGNTPAIIDYGKSAPEVPIGVDATRFLGGLVRDVLAEELSFEDLALVLSDILDLGASVSEADSPASRAVRLMKITMHKLVPSEALQMKAFWPVHLYGYAWIGMKWIQSSANSHRACFLLAAVSLQALLETTYAGHRHLLTSDDEKAQASVTASRPIKPEGAAEILILVSRFGGEADYDPTVRIYSTLSDNLFEILPSLARVEQVDEVVFTRKDAIALAKQYRASMIVWGTFDNLGVSPHYEVTRDSLVVKRSMIQLDQATRHQLSERFEPYITQNLAAEISFLSLKAVGEMCQLNLNLDAALKVYDRALSLIPDRERAKVLGAAEMYRSVAAIYFALRLDKQATTANDAALALDPKDLLSQLQKLQIQSRVDKRPSIERLRELKQLLRERLKEAVDDVEDTEAMRDLLIKLEPIQNSADLRKMIQTEMPKMQYTMATAPNKQFEKDVMVHLQRAEAYARELKLQESLREIKSALRLNPQCALALVMRAGVWAMMDQVEDALRELTKAEKLNSKIAQIYAYRGAIIRSGEKNYEDALKEFEKAFDLDELMIENTLSSWGKCMVELGRGNELMELLRKMEPDPTNPQLYIARSRYYRKNGQFELALQQADQSVHFINKISAEPYYERAEVYSAMGRRQQAIEDLERGLKRTLKGTFERRWFKEFLDKLISTET